MAVRYIDTGDKLTNAVANVKKLMEEHRDNLELREIFDYDDMLIGNYPALSIVFSSARPRAMSLGRRCNLMSVNLILYLYLESLDLQKKSSEQISRLSRLLDVIFDNGTLYGLCHSEPMDVLNSQFVGRRLVNDIALTAQVDISVPIRFCVA